MPVIRPKSYSLPVTATFHNPLDSTTYYFGNKNAIAPETSGANSRVYILKTGMIRKGAIWAFTENANGTAEDIVMSIRINNTTDYAFATVGVVGSKLFANYELNIPVAQGDYVTIKFVTPAWVTNPARVHYMGNLLIEGA